MEYAIPEGGEQKVCIQMLILQLLIIYAFKDTGKYFCEDPKPQRSARSPFISR
jgi:hypothetical protein